MENNLFQQAKNAVSSFTNKQGNASEQEKQAAKNAVQSAYADCSPEEKQQLQQLEQQLKTKNHLS
ncbi:hypothetical protein CFK37_00660 [Virgibacillus phasianinus]|uniref:DUF3813 domain-containing protein n=1 Tax=Virgibacillus phasianinus TaxID=2017483 RepID=A0A220TYK0_9BACI|nr:DUF3813 domain-containing protein [Virgibacillus phasianinus]ASK60820.1 hypothetical protein CFK37_00660 [Virgibacillus phasianinus]